MEDIDTTDINLDEDFLSEWIGRQIFHEPIFFSVTKEHKGFFPRQLQARLNVYKYMLL